MSMIVNEVDKEWVESSKEKNSASANSPQAPNPNSNPNAAMSPELEQTLSMLSSQRSVLSYMLVTRDHLPSIIRHSGVVFDGEQGRRYAAVVARIVDSVQAGLEEVRVDDGLTAAATDETDVVRGSFYPKLACITRFLILYSQGWDSIHENPDQETWDIDLPRWVLSVNGWKEMMIKRLLYQMTDSSSLFYMIQLHDGHWHIYPTHGILLKN